MQHEGESVVCVLMLLASEAATIGYLIRSRKVRPLTRWGLGLHTACRASAWLLLVYLPFATAIGHFSATWPYSHPNWASFGPLYFRWNQFFGVVGIGLLLPLGLGILIGYYRLLGSGESMAEHQPPPPGTLQGRSRSVPNATSVTAQRHCGVSKPRDQTQRVPPRRVE